MKRMFSLVGGITILGLFWYALSAEQNTEKDQIIQGQQVYNDYCATCHGEDLQGGMASSLVDGEWQFGSKDSHVFRNIKFGILHRGMPAFEDGLSDEQIQAVVAYMKNAEQDAGVIEAEPAETVQTLLYDLNVDTFADGLEIPWSIDFIKPSHALVTERPGPVWQIIEGRRLDEPISGTPEVLHQGQGGMMDVAIDPDYQDNGWIYLSYSHALDKPGERRPPAMTRIVRGRLQDNTWIDQQVIWESPPEFYRETRHHYGCRIVFDPDGYLYFAIGDRGASEHAQDVTRPNGKVHRIHRDGRIPQDNPFVDTPDAIKSIFTYGNRNAQGLAVHPQTGEVWETEHGPMGGDELNLLKAGVNYGWPEVTYGLNYNGTVISEHVSKPGMASPVLYWKPSIAVCGLDFYRGDQFSRWNNRLLVGALKYEQVRLLDIKDDRVMHEEVIFNNFGRVRDVATGPDGAIYVVLNSPDKVVKLTMVREKP
jgi:glucose/arabinose dehydrogenase